MLAWCTEHGAECGTNRGVADVLEDFRGLWKLLEDKGGSVSSKARKFGGGIQCYSVYLENIGNYHYFRQLWLVLRVKLMEVNSNLFSTFHGYFEGLTSFFHVLLGSKGTKWISQSHRHHVIMWSKSRWWFNELEFCFGKITYLITPPETNSSHLPESHLQN